MNTLQNFLPYERSVLNFGMRSTTSGRNLCRINMRAPTRDKVLVEGNAIMW